MTSQTTRSLITISLFAALGPVAEVGSTGERVPAETQMGFDWEEAVASIDALVENELRSQGVRPLRPTFDQEFVRRIYLDVIGRIPTYEEVSEFFNSNNPHKRSQLIEKLLASRGHVSHQFNYWADVLRVQDRDAGITRAFYVNWLKQSIAENMPYDDFARKLVTSSGCGWQRGSGAVGYYLRDNGMPLDNMANTMRVFVGTRLACAQCHNHPHVQWTRRQFYQMAAFTHGLQTQKKDKLFNAIYQREKVTTDQELRAFSQYIRNTFHRDRVFGLSSGAITLPNDYQYDDAAPGETVDAEVLFDASAADARGPNTDHRDRFADWLTSGENDRFTRVIANRLWKQAMGYGLNEPVDDLDTPIVSVYPEILDYLAEMMIDIDYDMRLGLRILFNTRTYQRATDPEGLPADEAPSFRGRLLKRMTAEQLWDSLVTMIVRDVDERETKLYDTSIFYHGKPVFVGEKDMSDRFNEIKDHDLDQHWEYLERELEAMRSDLDDSNNTPGASIGGFSAPLNSRGLLARASELRSPEAPAHFLRIFGQSSREFIDGGSTDANVSQFLSLFNGFIESNLIGNSEAALNKAIADHESIEGKVETIFSSILGRLPSENERATVATRIDERCNSQADDPWEDNLVWALLNTHEFVYVQ